MDFGNHLEHFSLRWNDFNDNMKSGLHDLLKTEDFVDVTIAAEGKLIQAHKMVLSVCSPYFKNIFKANPCQHPIVFLKDVTHKELSGILQFMYLGEVSIQQEELGRFLKTAEALQVKGLTGEDKDETEQENHKQHPVRNKTKLDSKDFNDKDSCSKKMKLSTINDLGKTSQVQNQTETVLNSQNHNLSNFRKTVIQELELSDGGNDEKNFFKEESVSINEPFFQLEDNNLELEDKDDEESPTFSGPPQEYLGGNQELSNEPFAMSDVNQDFKQFPILTKNQARCPICGRILQHKRNLRTHMSDQHWGKFRSFTCQICHKVSKTWSALRVHTNRHHSKDFPL